MRIIFSEKKRLLNTVTKRSNFKTSPYAKGLFFLYFLVLSYNSPLERGGRAAFVRLGRSGRPALTSSELVELALSKGVC